MDGKREKTQLVLVDLDAAQNEGNIVGFIENLLDDAYQEGYDDGYSYGDRV